MDSSSDSVTSSMSSPSFICTFCGKPVCSKPNLTRHLVSCKKKEIYELHELIQTLQQDLRRQQRQYEQELENERRQHEQSLQRQRKLYEEELQKEREQYERERMALEQKVEKLENQIFEIARQPHSIHHTTTTTSQTNNRTLNVTNQLGTYEFDEKRMEQILEENFTEDVFLGGPDKIAELAAHFLLLDPETQKPKVICTDASRKTYRYIDPDTHELQMDQGFQRTHRLIKRPLGQANLRVFYDSFLRNDPDDHHRDQWKVNDEFIENQYKFPEKVHSFLKK